MEKWDNTRDAFIRSLRKKSGQAVTEKYVYADFLQFLLKKSDKDDKESSICVEGKNETILRHGKRRKRKLRYSKWMKL
jgi:hypothetical protein